MKIPGLKIGDIETRLPIIQGGMGVGISMSSLASAVARSGGIGVIAAVLIGFKDPEFHKKPRETTFRVLYEEIKKAKEMASGGPIGVNIMVALEDYDEIVKISVEAGADIIISGAGLPLKLPSLVPEDSNTKLIPIVSSPRAVTIIARRWHEHFGRMPDGVVVEGPLAGGHLGFKPEDLDKPENKIENLIPKVVEAVKPLEDKAGRSIPVIAAGGIYTGQDIYNIMKLGASGVQMGTRFVATEECDASREFKEAYLKAKEEDVKIIISPVGLPGRAITGEFIEKVQEGQKRPKKCMFKCLKVCGYPNTPYCIGSALINAQRGNLKAGFVFCGHNVWRVDKIVPVAELMRELEEGFIKAAEKD
ncbi:Enoyl-[acyl-carrier-protein] reductase [Dissulfuribacter thermophilus]|uniref:Enoyl-[acyl-carrier-protein] reductase n=1 Tax=Dissulfuribacter thermophilus TaxID=1156395 RepID=A0A1B9F3Y1_9BACT|nr:nitronate monooxygenase family protein [Dissulfuribacter thermophilus]OCC14471.1 Enoyl-[acyl-carrier-protein] reductase [Dissulfuribacter thermophilus]